MSTRIVPISVIFMIALRATRFLVPHSLRYRKKTFWG